MCDIVKDVKGCMRGVRMCKGVRDVTVCKGVGGLQGYAKSTGVQRCARGARMCKGCEGCKDVQGL